MIEIFSFLKKGNHFTNINDCPDNMPLVEYLEGAIEINYCGNQLLGKNEFDYVDQLWVYILDGLCSLNEGKVFNTYFPDQPLELSFSPVNNSMFIFFLGREQPVKQILNIKEFSLAMLNAFEIFFKKFNAEEGSISFELNKAGTLRKFIEK